MSLKNTQKNKKSLSTGHRKKFSNDINEAPASSASLTDVGNESDRNDETRVSLIIRLKMSKLSIRNFISSFLP